MISYLTHVLRRACAVWAICDLLSRAGLPVPVTPVQLFVLLMIAGTLQAEWMPDHKLHEHIERERAVEEETKFLPVARLISVWIFYGVARFALWVAA